MNPPMSASLDCDTDVSGMPALDGRKRLSWYALGLRQCLVQAVEADTVPEVNDRSAANATSHCAMFIAGGRVVRRPGGTIELFERVTHIPLQVAIAVGGDIADPAQAGSHVTS
jgi:hypothetical protein